MSGDIDHRLTEDARDLLKQIEDDRKWHAYQRDVLEPRRAAEEAARQAEAAAVRHREAEYARALDASERWLGRPVDPPIADLIRHAVHIVLAEPEAFVYWLERNTRSEELLRVATGTALYASRSIVCPPIVDLDDVLTVYHEKGHLATLQRGTKLERECEAWEYARKHMPIWDHECQRGMVRSLQGYVNVASKSDILGVLQVERLCSTDEYRLEILRRLQLRLAAEEAQLQAQLKDRQCGRCERKPATELYANEPACAKCAAAARDDASQRAVDERITRLRQERARLGRSRARCITAGTRSSAGRSSI